MINRGVATFTLDTGHCPPWLFQRMVALGREMIRVMVAEYGPDEFIRRIADPVWFQSLGTVLAFDWNASGLTTILTAALKEAIRHEEADLGIFICGGKGKTSKKTPEEIWTWGERLALSERQTRLLAYNSKMSAKVDSSLVQDGYELYHHAFFFSEHGAWAVVQQGLNQNSGTARRYHWFSENEKDMISEPHAAIIAQASAASALDLTARKSAETRSISTELVQQSFGALMKDIKILRAHSSELSRVIAMREAGGEQLTLLELAPVEFKYHPVIWEDFSKSTYLEKILARLTAIQPSTYESLIATEGVGGKTARALALVAEVMYGARPSYEDPARYSFAHGGKDATPYPVDTETYDKTIATIAELVRKSRIQPQDKDKAIRRLTAAKNQ
jgi:hypothetical protein